MPGQSFCSSMFVHSGHCLSCSWGALRQLQAPIFQGIYCQTSRTHIFYLKTLKHMSQPVRRSGTTGTLSLQRRRPQVRSARINCNQCMCITGCPQGATIDSVEASGSAEDAGVQVAMLPLPGTGEEDGRQAGGPSSTG